MPKMMQIRNVPDDLHDELTKRAKRARKTLTFYLTEILEREVSKPPREEVFAKIHTRKKIKLKYPAAKYLSDARGERNKA